MSHPHFLLEDYAGVTVVTLTDTAILDAAVIERMARDLYELADKQNKQRLILDFTNVKAMSSHTLGVLITLKKKMTAIKGELALCGMRKEAMKIFSITGLDKEFRFFADDSAALASFNIRVT